MTVPQPLYSYIFFNNRANWMNRKNAHRARLRFGYFQFALRNMK